TGWRGRIPKKLPYSDSPLGHLSLDEYLEFIGYYISEGGSKEERGKNLKKEKIVQACSISQSKNSDVFEQVESSIASVYPSYSTYHDSRGNGCEFFTINNVEIARYLANEFGPHSWNKKIPRWIRDLPKNKLKVLYKSMMAGDGDVRSDNLQDRFRYVTVSKQLADDWSDICLKLGYWPTSSIENNTDKYPNRRLIHRTYWSENRKETKFNLRKQHMLREDYEGKVYCVKVPNSWVFVRKNGRIAICGNTGKIHNITG
ncbi:unnamed protein product, partial [marine sediment metagenome]